MKVEAGKDYMVPDGYFPSGSSRPHRPIKALQVIGRLTHFVYLDTKEKGTIPTHGIIEHQ
jgi:hypothetical protein